MAPDESKVIGKLAEYYPGATSTRSLWIWAGGLREAIHYNRSPQEQWAALWELASEESRVTPITLVREALFDHPGDDELFSFLGDLVKDHFPVWKETAEVFRAQLKKLAPDLDAPLVAAAARSLPDLPEDQTFAMIGGTLRDLFSGELRQKLETRFTQLSQDGINPTPSDIAKGAQLLLRIIPELSVPEDMKAFGTAAGEIAALLKTVSDTATDSLAPLIDRIAEKLIMLQDLPVASDKTRFDAAVSGIQRQLDGLRKTAAGEPIPSVRAIGRAGVHLVWATIGQLPEGEAETGEEEKPSVNGDQ